MLFVHTILLYRYKCRYYQYLPTAVITYEAFFFIFIFYNFAILLVRKYCCSTSLRVSPSSFLEGHITYKYDTRTRRVYNQGRKEPQQSVLLILPTAAAAVITYEALFFVPSLLQFCKNLLLLQYQPTGYDPPLFSEGHTRSPYRQGTLQYLVGPGVCTTKVVRNLNSSYLHF